MTAYLNDLKALLRLKYGHLEVLMNPECWMEMYYIHFDSNLIEMSNFNLHSEFQ